MKVIDRIARLRVEMKKQNIDWVLIPSDDYHQSEYVDDYFKVREFFSGFDGSAGTLLISRDSAYLWTDGRYFLQASRQLEGSGIRLMKDGERDVPPIEEFLEGNLKDGSTLAYDGRTVSYEFGKRIRYKLISRNIAIKSDFDPADSVWSGRPSFPEKPIWLLDEEYSGQSALQKMTNLRASVKDEGADAILIATLADIAWLYNFRGDDILFTPVAMAYTIISSDDAVLYISDNALSPKARDYFANLRIRIKPYFHIYEDVITFDGRLMMDSIAVNETLALSAVNPVFRDNPTSLYKSKKNFVETVNERLAHLKDGVALTRMIHLIREMEINDTIHNETELSIERKLTEFRRHQGNFISLSFGTIVASGDHGAIVHYEPTEETDRCIQNGFLLIDSGAHYINGTTDVTRTISIGEPTDEMKKIYTAVLMGNLDLGMTIFPEGTRGGQLDSIARRPIWALGLDYKHGTGHGVGYLLSVHEGPNNIRRPNLNASGAGLGEALCEGMITSNEPGVYLDGKFGVRIENLIYTRKSQICPDEFLEFETLTLVPYDRRSIIPEMLSDDEKRALNAYHKHVYDMLCIYLNAKEQNWLKEETAPI